MYTFWFSIFFMLSCASAASLGRRHLYDDAGLPPPLTPTSPPFFPLYTFAPPPSPPPTTFPANISALVLPRSPKPHPASPTLVIPALCALLALATAIGVALFLYGRWRGQKRHFKDSSHDEPRNITSNLSVAVTTSNSEVFYLESDHIRSAEPVKSFVNPKSPEIRPLPPLPPRSFQHCYEADFLSEQNEDDDEDEFYSPLASLAGSESSSPSRSGFEPDGPYRTCSCSSSTWVSPARSFSITMSPPFPQRSNPRYSDASSDQNLQSPSPERLRVRNNNRKGSSLRMFSFWNQNVGFPRIFSASTSPDRGTIRTPDVYAPSSVSTSPDGFFRKFLDSSPPIWNDFSRNVKSVLLSSDSASSRRDFSINMGESCSAILNPEFGRRQQSEAAAPPPPTRPPPLVPPPQPFVLQNSGKKPSFSELHWDKLGESSCQKIAWDRLRSSSFKLNKEMVETLFIANSSTPNIKQKGLNNDFPILNRESKVLDPRKAENIATLLRLLNLTTKDVCQALLDGDCDALGAELLECLSKLKSCSDDSVKKLYPAERFLKELRHVPFVFKRIDALLYVANFHPEIEYLRKLLGVVQAACKEVMSSRMLSILVETALETGNQMKGKTNRCDGAHAFKLDTLLKLVEVKGLDGRSSLLHFVVQEVIKSEALDSSLNGIRSLSSELENVKRSADIEYGVLRSDVLKVYQGINNIKELLLLSEESGPNGDEWVKFREVMAQFLETAQGEIVRIGMQESSMLSALEEVTEQFHGDSAKEEGHTLRLFRVVRDFLSILDKVCNEMGD